MSRFSFQQFPLQYASRGKRDPQAGLPFFLDNIGDDLLIVLVAFVLFSPAPVLVALAIVFLHFSFWSVYEIGYYENDAVASKLEHDPQIPSGFGAFEGSYSSATAYVWAAALGVAGVGCVWWSGAGYFAATGGGLQFALLLVVWTAFLAALRWLFFVYNHVDKMTRVFVYLPLQILKYGFPVLFFPLAATGAALVLAQIMRRWSPYLVYRFARKTPVEFPSRLVRLSVFATIWLLLLPSQLDRAFLLHGAVVFALLVLRARSQIRKVLRNARHVGADDWKKE